MTLVGNTIMMHLFAGLTTQYITVLPFTPVYTKGFSLKAGQAGLAIHPEASVELLPCVAGYVGADTVAAVLASDLHEREELCLLVDIGTNGEIVLGNREGILCCSAAAGPAFEGAHIRHGMGGVAGAISHVRLEHGQVYCETIGNVPAVGICGSGLVDAIAQLLTCGAMDMMGAFDEESAPEWAERFTEVDGKTALRLTDGEPPIVLCQKDLREVQLAKGAIAAGIEVLLAERGVAVEDVKHLYLAGGFGNFIDHDSACAIGLLPMGLRNVIHSIGNAAGAGAKMALMDEGLLYKAQEVAHKMRYIELSSRADFQNYFVEKMLFE